MKKNDKLTFISYSNKNVFRNAPTYHVWLAERNIQDVNMDSSDDTEKRLAAVSLEMRVFNALNHQNQESTLGLSKHSFVLT